MIAPRRQGVEYSIEHHGHRFLILHNDGAEDFALAYTSADTPGDWVPLIEHTPGTRLESVDAFADHLVVSLRRDGLTGLRVLAVGSTDSLRHRLPRADLQRRPGRQPGIRHRQRTAALHLAGHARTRSTTTTW